MGFIMFIVFTISPLASYNNLDIKFFEDFLLKKETKNIRAIDLDKKLV